MFFLRGEQLVIFLENSARLSLGKEDFAQSFSAYLVKANRLFGVEMKFEDFSFEKTDGSLVAVCGKKFLLRNSGIEYSIRPSFVIKL